MIRMKTAMEFTLMFWVCFFFKSNFLLNPSNILHPSCSYFSWNSLLFSMLFYFLGGGRFMFFAWSQKIQCIVGGEATLVLAEHHKTKRVIKWRKPFIFLSQAFWYGWAFWLQKEDQEKKLLKIECRIRRTVLETSCYVKALHSQVLELLLFPL